MTIDDTVLANAGREHADLIARTLWECLAPMEGDQRLTPALVARVGEVVRENLEKTIALFRDDGVDETVIGAYWHAFITKLTAEPWPYAYRAALEALAPEQRLN